MNKIKYTLVLLFGLAILSTTSRAQCDADKHKNQCVAQLADGYTFIKSYLLNDGKLNSSGEIEYSFVFSSGTTYMLTFANALGASENIEIKLFDPNKKMLASNYDKKSGRFFPIGYKCKATGIHYMTFKFIENADVCGLSVLGFKRG